MTSDFWYWDFNSQILTLKLGKQENLRSIEYLYFYMLCSNLYFYQSMWAVLGFQILFCLAPSPSQISIFFVGKEYNVNLPDITWIQFVIFFFIKNFSEQVSLIFHRFISLILMFQEKFAFKNQKFCVVGNSWQWPRLRTLSRSFMIMKDLGWSCQDLYLGRILPRSWQVETTERSC